MNIILWPPLAIEYFFIDDLSLWYVRRSRDRFRREEENNKEAIEVFFLLLDLLKITGLITPFFSEEMYQRLRSDDMPESIHLFNWPKADKKLIDAELEKEMAEARKIVALALAERADKGVKVRQPLRELRIRDKELGNEKKLLELIKDEVNVKNIVCGAKIEKEVELDFEISEELKREGDRRELVRNINKIRKETGLTPIDLIIIESDFEVIGAKENLMKEVKAKDYIVKSEIKNGTEVTISGKKYFVKITKS